MFLFLNQSTILLLGQKACLQSLIMIPRMLQNSSVVFGRREGIILDLWCDKCLGLLLQWA